MKCNKIISGYSRLNSVGKFSLRKRTNNEEIIANTIPNFQLILNRKKDNKRKYDRNPHFMNQRPNYHKKCI